MCNQIRGGRRHYCTPSICSASANIRHFEYDVQHLVKVYFFQKGKLHIYHLKGALVLYTTSLKQSGIVNDI